MKAVHSTRMGRLRSNMFAVVGQRVPDLECENIYETIENCASQIERDLLHAARNVDISRVTGHRDRKDRALRDSSIKDRDRNPKDRHRYVRDRMPLPKPIVIYEEPEQPITCGDNYVIAFRHQPITEADTYETIGSPESESEHERLLNAKNWFVCSESSSGVRSSSCLGNVTPQPIKRPDVERITVSQSPKAQPLTGQERYQNRMEAIAKKVAVLKGKGQLKLSVYINSGLLTIHVVQARHLSSKRTLNCTSYVKLSLVPDDIKRTRCKTDLVAETNNPMFDEKFSFELLEEDFKKRLLFSMWSRDESNQRSEFLGCMSFGINHIRSSRRVVNGWYYLLMEDVGRRKHLRVVDRKSGGAQSQGALHADLQWLDRHIVVVRRGEAGYGFTVSGTSPPQVCRLEPGSLAEVAGLQKNDCIVRINGHNVCRAGSDSVAKIVRHAQNQVVLEVQRSRTPDSLLASPWKPTMCSTFLPSAPGSDVSDDDDDVDDEAQEPEVGPAYNFRPVSSPPAHLEDFCEERDHRCYLTGSRGSTGSGGSGHSSGSGSGRYYRESLV